MTAFGMELGVQHDSDEFFRHVLSTIHDLTTTERSGMELPLHERGAVVGTAPQVAFEGITCCTMTCSECMNTSSRLESFLDQLCEVTNDTGSLENCLDAAFERVETLDGDNMYACLWRADIAR
jgi:hypothetical protein